MANKICVQCSTENAEHYRFCKNCGATLPVVDQINSGRYEYREESYTRPYASPENYQYDTISGEELSVYVDTNADKIMPKFFAMQLALKKTSWCFPVFIFGILFGFFGMAFWFISRKMFKMAAILAAVGIIFIGADIAVNYDAQRALARGCTEVIAEVTDAAYNADEQKIEYEMARLEFLFGEYTRDYNPIISGISDYVGSIFLPIFFGMYAMYMYKSKAIKDIKKIKANYPDDEFLMARISEAGGRKGALALIPIALMIICSVLSLAVLFI